MLSKLDKKVFKLFNSHPTQLELEYMPWKSDQEKIVFVRMLRNKLRKEEQLKQRAISIIR